MWKRRETDFTVDPSRTIGRTVFIITAKQEGWPRPKALPRSGPGLVGRAGTCPRVPVRELLGAGCLCGPGLAEPLGAAAPAAFVPQAHTQVTGLWMSMKEAGTQGPRARPPFLQTHHEGHRGERVSLVLTSSPWSVDGVGFLTLVTEGAGTQKDTTNCHTAGLPRTGWAGCLSSQGLSFCGKMGSQCPSFGFVVCSHFLGAHPGLVVQRQYPTHTLGEPASSSDSHFQMESLGSEKGRLVT